MCGVIGFFPSSENKLIEEFKLDRNSKGFEKLLNLKIVPRSEIATISGESKSIIPRIWWLIPHWIKDPKEAKFPTFNARAESIKEKPSFAKVWNNSQRCIIPASFFVEWKQELNVDNNKLQKNPYVVKPAKDEFFSLAGLYETWIGSEGRRVDSCTIITTSPNQKMKEFHDRMPVILNKEDQGNWLDKSYDREEIFKKIKPAENEAIEIFGISNLYNKTSAEEMTLDLLRPLNK